MAGTTGSPAMWGDFRIRIILYVVGLFDYVDDPAADSISFSSEDDCATEPQYPRR